MSCSTGFVLRDADGNCFVMWQKQSWWDLTRADHLAEALATIRRTGIPVDRASTGFLARYHCNGFAIDMLEKRCHLYVCGEGQGASYFDSLASNFAAQPLWTDWEVRYAWGGHESFAAAVPQAAHVVQRDLEPSPSSSTSLYPRENWFVDWDPVRREITVAHNEYSADWYGDPCATISIIGPGNSVLDYRLDSDFIMEWLAEHGDSAISVLAESSPYPLPYEEHAHAGAVVDLAGKRLRYWTFDKSRPVLHDYIAAAWPGWRIERLPFGYVGHLAVTGRADHDALIEPEQLLTSYWWNEDLLTHREQARHAMALPRETFQLCRVIARL